MLLDVGLVMAEPPALAGAEAGEPELMRRALARLDAYGDHFARTFRT